MRRCFIDASAFIAIAYADDAHHAEARAVVRSLADLRLPQVTTSYVLAETYTVLRRVASHRSAVLFGEAVQRSVALRRLSVVQPDPALDAAAWAIFARYADHAFSFVDCVSFAWLQANPGVEVFAFDRHFDMMGFARFQT
jgi:uncharacterized protein